MLPVLVLKIMGSRLFCTFFTPNAYGTQQRAVANSKLKDDEAEEIGVAVSNTPL
jgi:hypothetical protein